MNQQYLNTMNAMKLHSRLFAALLAIAALSLSACEGGHSPGANTPASAAPEPEVRKIASVEVYNRTGKIQREDYYDLSSASGSVSYSVEYDYTDSGSLSAVKKNGGGIGSNAPIESYFYSGQLCTRRILYDEHGSTKVVYYWTYDKKGVLLTEIIVSMIPDASGYSYLGKSEQITQFSEDGTAQFTTFSSPDGYSKDEFTYDEAGNLLTDKYSHSSDGETFRLFETRSFTYDADGNLTSKMYADALGNVTFLELLEYKSGRLIRDTVYSSYDVTEENVVTRTVCEYNAAGLLSSKAEFRGKDSVQTYYEYDASGNCTLTGEQRFVAGVLAETKVTAAEYDAHGNPVRETEKINDGPEKVTAIREYGYYDDGKIKTITNYLCE